MSLSLSDLHCLIDEIAPQLTGAILQKVQAISDDEIQFSFYYQRPLRLFCSTKAGNTLLFLSNVQWKRHDKIPNFILFARKHLLGQQLQKMEVTKLSRTCWLRFSQHSLVLELWHTQGNALILDANDKLLYSLKPQPIAYGQSYPHPEEEAPRIAPSLDHSHDINRQIEQLYLQRHDKNDDQKLNKQWQKLLQRQERKIKKLQEDLADASDAKRYYDYGFTLQNQIYQLPKTTYYESRLPLFTADGFPLPLPRRMTPPQALQHYFKMHKKLERKATQVEQRLQLERAHLQALQNQPPPVTPAHTNPHSAGITATKKSNNKKVKLPNSVREVISPDGFRLWLGKNAQGNDQLLKLAKGNDLWMHVRDFPGCHGVIVREGKKQIPDTTLHWAAALTLMHSKAKSQGHGDIIIAARADVKKFKHAKPGEVQVLRSKTLHIKLKSD